MKQILVYGDSLSWGIIPGTRKRLAFAQRWPGILESQLNARGHHVRVIEDCLNGRRTVWEDPFKPSRSGLTGLSQCIESNSPLELFVLLLGTNDFQSTHEINVAESAQGVAAIIAAVRNAPIEPGLKTPNILVVAPPKIVEPKGSMAEKFRGANHRSVGLAAELGRISKELSVFFFDANTVTDASTIDGIHLDEDQHLTLGVALAEKVLGGLYI